MTDYERKKTPPDERLENTAVSEVFRVFHPQVTFALAIDKQPRSPLQFIVANFENLYFLIELIESGKLILHKK